MVLRPHSASIALSAARPNPAHGSVSWTLALPRAAAVRWEVLDLQGRCLWRESREASAGMLRVDWRAGHSVSPGVYLLALHAGATTFTRRFVILP